jgi:hypothetical protein
LELHKSPRLYLIKTVEVFDKKPSPLFLFIIQASNAYLFLFRQKPQYLIRSISTSFPGKAYPKRTDEICDTARIFFIFPNQNVLK